MSMRACAQESGKAPETKKGPDLDRPYVPLSGGIPRLNAVQIRPPVQNGTVLYRKAPEPPKHDVRKSTIPLFVSSVIADWWICRIPQLAGAARMTGDTGVRSSLTGRCMAKTC